jgi:hypothetical protein
MPVSGKEISSLDFANLIGGPLNAIVEAQAKSAITTVNFIKEVAFNKDGQINNVEFKYNRKNDSGKDQMFSMTVPFLTMLPVPYITISNALIEFNAKITSVNESSVSDDFSQTVEAEAGGNWWFCSARVTSKTSYQRKSSSSEKEERSFDMHVKVEAKNQDMPAGTERLLTILENSISEKAGKTCLPLSITGYDSATGTVTFTCENPAALEAAINTAGSKSTTPPYFFYNKAKYTISGLDIKDTTACKFVMADASSKHPEKDKLDVTAFFIEGV